MIHESTNVLNIKFVAVPSPCHPIWFWVLIDYERQWTTPWGNWDKHVTDVTRHESAIENSLSKTGLNIAVNEKHWMRIWRPLGKTPDFQSRCPGFKSKPSWLFVFVLVSVSLLTTYSKVSLKIRIRNKPQRQRDLVDALYSTKTWTGDIDMHFKVVLFIWHQYNNFFSCDQCTQLCLKRQRRVLNEQCHFSVSLFGKSRAFDE